jgi:hypothetical protein
VDFIVAKRHAARSFLLQLLESHYMFSNQISDEVLTSKYSNPTNDSSIYALGWSFSDSACSFFTSLAADSTFFQRFRACATGDSEVSECQRSVPDLSSSRAATYVLSKITQNSSGSIEYMNIMYWADRFQMCESQQDAVAYDEAKESECRSLIWPYRRSSYNDVNGFCSCMSLYLFQV